MNPHCTVPARKSVLNDTFRTPMSALLAHPKRRRVRTALLHALRSCAVLLPVGVLSIANAREAHAQPRAAQVATDSLIRYARARAGVGDTLAALELLEQATDQSPRDVDALYWRGVVLSRTTGLTLGDSPRRILAWHLLSRAANIDGKNPRYLIELGRIRLHSPLLRIEAERYFRRALVVAVDNGDPEQLAEVSYELGQIKERRYNSGRDRWLYTANLVFDPIAARSRLHYTREFLDQMARPIDRAAFVDRIEAEEFYRRALAAESTHALSAIGLMALLYDQKRYDEMRQIGAPFTRTIDATPRLLFAHGLAAFKLGQLADADQLFARALLGLAPAMRAEVLSMGRILRKGDSVRVANLSAADLERTESAFWEAADPMLSTSLNEARLEFLARMAYADLRFTDGDTKQLGWRTDRALIVARYGEPPVVATFAPNSDADAADAIGRIITVWFYPRTEMEFVFTGPPAMNSAYFAGNYRDYAEERRDASPFLLDNVPLAMAVDTVPIQMVRFRGPTSRQTQLLVAASFSTKSLYHNAEIDRGALELAFRIGPPGRLSLRAADTLQVRLPSITTDLRRRWVDTLRTGAYRVRIEARDASVATALGRAQSEVEMLGYDTLSLQSSDILIADRAPAATRTVRSWIELGLVPRGDLALAPLDTFTVYWENYGLRPDANKRVKFQVQFIVTLLKLDRGRDVVRNFLGNIADAVGLSAVGDAQLGLKYERDEALDGRDRVPGVVNLGMGTAPAGRYRLEIFVTDHSNGQRTHTQRELTIRRQ